MTTANAKENSMQVPPARRALLEAMSDAQLEAELADVRKHLAVHAAHASTHGDAASAADALRHSESYALTILNDRKTA